MEEFSSKNNAYEGKPMLFVMSTTYIQRYNECAGLQFSLINASSDHHDDAALLSLAKQMTQEIYMYTAREVNSDMSDSSGVVNYSLPRLVSKLDR